MYVCMYVCMYVRDCVCDYDCMYVAIIIPSMCSSHSMRVYILQVNCQLLTCTKYCPHVNGVFYYQCPASVSCYHVLFSGSLAVFIRKTNIQQEIGCLRR